MKSRQNPKMINGYNLESKKTNETTFRYDFLSLKSKGTPLQPELMNEFRKGVRCKISIQNSTYC